MSAIYGCSTCSGTAGRLGCPTHGPTTYSTPSMTPGTEPTTEAGRRYLSGGPPHFTSTRDAILAIEAEARADCDEALTLAETSNVQYEAGRADALREAAERVRALLVKYPTANAVLVPDVLAILDPETP